MPIADNPFPEYHGIPKGEMWAAYAWELDREFLEDQWERRPWPRLFEWEKRDVEKCIGSPVYDDEVPPSAAWFYEPFRLAQGVTQWGEPKIMGKSMEEWGPFFAALDYCKRHSKHMADEPREKWKHLFDRDGKMRVVFAIDPKRPIQDVLADIRVELERLHRFPPKKNPTRKAGWASRLCDLLCLRLKRSGHELNEAIEILTPFQESLRLKGLVSKKDWSTRTGRAKRAIAVRRKKLEWRAKKQDEYDRDKYGHPPDPEYRLPLSTWGLHGWEGPRGIGLVRPHEYHFCGVCGGMMKPYLDWVTATYGETRQQPTFDWAVAFEGFKVYRDKNPSIVGAAFQKSEAERLRSVYSDPKEAAETGAQAQE